MENIRDRTFRFALDSIRFTKSIAEEKKEFILTKQLMRSATSVGANIREATNAQSKADFIHKMSISQKELDETTYWIELIQTNYELRCETSNHLHKESLELMRIIRTIILNTKKNLKRPQSLS